MHRSIIAADVVGFGRPSRTDAHRSQIRRGLYAAMEHAFSSCGLPWRRAYRDDSGDGLFVLLDASVAKERLSASLPYALLGALREHNAEHVAEAGIRLRLAIHSGEVRRDDHGVVGQALNHTFRLLDAPEFKRMMRTSAAPLGLIVSDAFFCEIVRGNAASNPSAYRPVDVRVKETDARGWVLLPAEESSASGAADHRPLDGLRVCDVMDPVLLRVHPAKSETGAIGKMPDYVRRDAEKCLLQALSSTAFVLVVGDATAGKSRLAYEALHRGFPEHLLRVPTEPAELRRELETVGTEERVIWLDDLERFLVPDGLNVDLVARHLGASERRVLILATMRSVEHAKLSPRRIAQDVMPGTSWSHVGRDVIRLAHEVWLNRLWSPAEVTRAASSVDPRVLEAARHAGEFGIAEYLAAGPQLFTEWREGWTPGIHPRGAALVAAAVDAYRAGVRRGLSVDLLRRLHRPYLERRGGRILRPEPFSEALAWASEPLHATSGLLVPAGRGHRAFSYLVDEVERDPNADPVAAETWQTLVERLPAAECWDVGLAAFARRELDAAKAAFVRSAEAGNFAAELKVVECAGEAGDRRGALKQLEEVVGRRACELGSTHRATLDARRVLATWIGRTGDPAGAVVLMDAVVDDLAAVLGPRHVDVLSARHSQAYWLGRAGRIHEAVLAFKSLVEDRDKHSGAEHPDTFAARHELANWLGRDGGEAEAMRLHEELVAARSRVLGTHHPDTLVSRHRWARFVCQVRGPETGLPLIEAAIADRAAVLGAGHPQTLRSRAQLARWTGKAGRPAEAAALYRDLASDSSAALGLEHPDTLRARRKHARWTAEAGDVGGAILLLEEVIGSSTRLLGPHHPDTLECRYRLALLLRSAGREDDARISLGEVAEESAAVLGESHPYTRAAYALLESWTKVGG
jgi:tetratricopeptide repeat protein